MSDSQKILELNAFNMAASGDLDPALARLLARRQKTFGPTSMLFYKKPLNLVRGDGAFLFDADGTRYLDAYNNVPSVGHCHPGVVAAVAKQMATLNTHTRYLYDIIYTYAEKLLATFPAEMSNIVFTCTGSESVDLALRIARTVTGGTGFIATANAYHGNTTTATEVSPASANAEAPNPAISFIPAPDTYRNPNGEAERKFVAGVGDAITGMKRRGIRFAGLIADSIFSSDGVYPCQAGFLKPVVDLVHAECGLYIADEVQPGFGRTGETMWGFQRHDIVPDLAVMGKPMGNGFPVGGVAVKPGLLHAFGSKSGYFNTFGGSPVAAAAGLAVLEALEADRLQQNAKTTGADLLAALQKLASASKSIGDVRGAGLYVGVEFVRDKQTKEPDMAAALAAVNGLRDRNILIGTAGKHGNCLKIRPPLCFAKDHANMLVGALAALLDAPQ